MLHTVVVGDKESQLSKLNKLGKGIAVELDKDGNRMILKD